MVGSLGKCHKHPEREAKYECHVCHVLMCDECALFDENGRPICHACMMKKAAAENVDRTKRERQELQEQRIRRNKEKIRNKMIAWSIVAILSAIAIVVELYIYKSMDTSPSGANVVPLTENLSSDEALLTFVHGAIEDFKASNGRYPASLSELLESGLLGDLSRDGLSRIYYRQTKAGADYMLKLTSGKPPFDRLFFTSSGIKVANDADDGRIP